MGITSFLLVLLLLAAFTPHSHSKYIAYNTTGGIVPGKINVHLVPHTHDDVGWLKTVDQYYVGSNNSIQGACVQNVLDSLVPALMADKNRRFIYVEMAFFERWWRGQSEAIQNIVEELVSSGRLEFINGGMCMHDEAAPHYIDMIDQTTLGHQFLKKEFDITPRIGWQIDPFGHSAVQAYLLGAEIGFDAIYFGRIDYQDRDKRKVQKSLEVVWRGSKTLGSSSQIFAGAFPANYEPPNGFYFEVNDNSPVVQDDPLLFDYNVQERVDDFVAAAFSQANITSTNHIMWTMGTDFKYQYANSWFRQLDKLIHYVNMDGRVNAFYSTPSFYTDTKYATNEAWPLKTGDYFPYADRANGYWTGYFTSRPGLKGYVRVMSGYYMAARQLEFFKGKGISGPTTDFLADALAIAQHHDAVSGTSKQHVADDYAKRLSMGYQDAAKVVQSSLACLTESKAQPKCDKLSTKFDQCPLLNVSYCPATEIDLSNGKSLVIVVYNSLGWKREDVVKIPVGSADVAVHDSEGKEIEHQVFPVTSHLENFRSFYVKAHLGASPSNTHTPKFWLAFMATVSPLGFNTYIVSNEKARGHILGGSHLLHGSNSGSIQLGSGSLKLLFDAKGKLIEYINSKSSVKVAMNQSYAYYAGDDGSGKDPQASGAYIFRPNGSFVITTQDKVPVTVFRGLIFDEIHVTVNSWISQFTRVYREKDHAEIEFIIGPIPVDDQVGKEVITQLTTSMVTNKTFYTDSSGRDFIQRTRDYRSDWDLQVYQPVAGNYYPINLGIYVQDKDLEFSVLVDRATGGSSILDGQIELMLHRRLLHDDGRGVAEALNETVCAFETCQGLTIQGKFYFRVDPLGDGAKWRRKAGQELYSPFLLAFAQQEGGENWNTSHVSTFSAMDASYSLPDNVAIITLQELKDGMILLRLAHLFEVEEDKHLSAMTSVNLRKLFAGKKISKVREMNLSGNQERETMEKKRLSWKVKDDSNDVRGLRGAPLDHSNLVVQLGPMEIRTFLIKLDYISILKTK